MVEPRLVGSAREQGQAALGGNRLQFLATKVVPPQCPGLIERPRLSDLAARLPERRLAAIRAPAGFGKTSLAVTWLQRLQQSGNSVAWLTIDPDDDEPATFLFYVCHALRRALDRVGVAAIELIQESFLTNPRTLLSRLLYELADVDDDVYLFLEDYHLIDNPEIHDTLDIFLRKEPAHCHLVITTRNELPLSLASLRARNHLLEIDAFRLRFDLEETERFLAAEGIGGLVRSEVAHLLDKTEGWPAAVRIAAYTARQSRQDFGQYLRGLSGTQRPIGGYFDEMLAGLPRDLVQFMLRTAILDRLSAPLCEIVTGANSGRELLRAIEDRQLLLTPLDQEGRWYRYHRLLAEYLADRLNAEMGNEIPGLHQRAALWYASQELWTEAVQHAIAAGDTARALSWLQNAAMALVRRGDLLTLLAWQRVFPPALMRSQPEVGLAIAWGLALAMRFDEALKLLEDIERDAAAGGSPNDEAARWECRAIRSVSIALKDDSETALSLAEDCVGRAADPWTANVASNVVRFGYLKRGDLKRFYATPWRRTPGRKIEGTSSLPYITAAFKAWPSIGKCASTWRSSTASMPCASPSSTSGRTRSPRHCPRA